ncbi:hypothetical protein GCM10023324_16480 [Streptomyces youssoufiensis]
MPSDMPGWVSALCVAEWAMPKSMTRGPSEVSSTFDGFRSRCTRPAAWIATSASTRPAASARVVDSSGGACAATASDSETPGT